VWEWNSHSQKWELGVLLDSQKLRAWLQGSKNLELGVLYTFGKVLKCRCPKWPHMSHLDICSPSYGQKKGWESNWQFDSRPLKVVNRPEFDVIRWRATRLWKALKESYKIASDSSQSKVWPRSYGCPKSQECKPGQFWDSTLGVPGKMTFGCSLHKELQRILYGGRWWLPSSLGRGESSESVLPVACSNTKSDPECGLTFLWLVLDAGPYN
jgi:hypothetical protein